MKCSKCDAPATIGFDEAWCGGSKPKEYAYFCDAHSPVKHWSNYAFRMSLNNGKIVEVENASHS